MTEKFKTKYHALAWAAEDENNVFVDGDNANISLLKGLIYFQALKDSSHHTAWHLLAYGVDGIKEPCHKLEVEKSNEESVYDKLHTIWQDSGSLKMLQVLFDECDNRYARKK